MQRRIKGMLFIALSLLLLLFTQATGQADGMTDKMTEKVARVMSWFNLEEEGAIQSRYVHLAGQNAESEK